jgi:hypothetical protein
MWGALGGRGLVLGACVAALSVALAVPAWGAREQRGNIIVSLSGEVTPHELPREGAVPASIRTRSVFSTANHRRLPQLRRIDITLGGQGALSYSGLPMCPMHLLHVTTEKQARAACGAARVGYGRMRADIVLPGQGSSTFGAQLIAFNGRLRDGSHSILVDAHSKAPPVSFVMPFVLHGTPGGETRLSAKLPADAGGWAHVRGFDLTLKRRYRDMGKLRSFVNAGCPAPHGFDGMVFPLAEATYVFTGGRKVTTEALGACNVSK